MQIKRYFEQSALVRQALTTKGYAYEHQLDYDNQRLEFLGDAVMDLILSEYLFQQPDLSEGQLTRLRASAVCEASFARIAKRFRLDEDLLVAANQPLIDSLLADAFEAFIGAYYLTNGYQMTKEFVVRSIVPLMDLSPERDPKSKLQEKLQARGNVEIKYETLSQTGPDHETVFEVGLLVDGVQVAKGQGRSKKEAQKAAAADYLERL